MFLRIHPACGLHKEEIGEREVVPGHVHMEMLEGKLLTDNILECPVHQLITTPVKIASNKAQHLFHVFLAGKGKVMIYFVALADVRIYDAVPLNE